MPDPQTGLMLPGAIDYNGQLSPYSKQKSIFIAAGLYAVYAMYEKQIINNNRYLQVLHICVEPRNLYIYLMSCGSCSYITEHVA